MVIKEQLAAGFSRRFNILLDHAGVPATGRDQYLGTRYERSKAGGRKWLKEDVVPRNIRDIVADLIQDIEGSLRVGPVMQWLLYDKDEFNPFQQNKRDEINHLLLSAIYTTVHKTARVLEIPIETIPQAKINQIYDTVLRACMRYRCETPDSDLIKDLLILISDKGAD